MLILTQRQSLLRNGHLKQKMFTQEGINNFLFGGKI